MRTDSPPVGKNEAFMALRPHLYVIAYHILANSADAEDMVQECFLRWEKTDASQVRIPKAFLTTIVTRLCLKHLQSARVQREEPFGFAVPEALEPAHVDEANAHARLAESLSEALLVVLKALSPLERAVFLLREVFDCEYGHIAGIVDKSEENCRQISGGRVTQWPLDGLATRLCPSRQSNFSIVSCKPRPTVIRRD
jgi:RNA polymerase sigma-70 factor (ECF subfamily)